VPASYNQPLDNIIEEAVENVNQTLCESVFPKLELPFHAPTPIELQPIGTDLSKLIENISFDVTHAVQVL